MAQGHRPDRVGDQIRQELSELLTRGDVHDPGIGFITLTRVQVSPDLQIARVFYTTLGDPKARHETAKALERATPFLRRQIGGACACAGCPSRVPLRRVDRSTRTASSRSCATCTRRKQRAAPHRARPPTDDDERLTRAHRAARRRGNPQAAALRASTSHVRPDGDAIGSQLAMALRAARSSARRCASSIRDPPPPPLQVFPGVERHRDRRARRRSGRLPSS